MMISFTSWTDSCWCSRLPYRCFDSPLPWLSSLGSFWRATPRCFLHILWWCLRSIVQVSHRFRCLYALTWRCNEWPAIFFIIGWSGHVHFPSCRFLEGKPVIIWLLLRCLLLISLIFWQTASFSWVYGRAKLQSWRTEGPFLQSHPSSRLSAFHSALIASSFTIFSKASSLTFVEAWWTSSSPREGKLPFLIWLSYAWSDWLILYALIFSGFDEWNSSRSWIKASFLLLFPFGCFASLERRKTVCERDWMMPFSLRFSVDSDVLSSESPLLLSFSSADWYIPSVLLHWSSIWAS